ncbi:MAG TPA: FAD-dependent oxidoreductase [Chitinophagaceae bacterium]|nr:FAD-dependent oxidoreductase [Chitinophagaceae bacterium]
MRQLFFLLVFGVFTLHGMGQSQKTDVLVIGGGVGGTAAGIQAARSGVKTIIVEEGPWLGGMLSAAGVSAIDGNHELPSGIWGEFRQRLYNHYGGPSKLATGWVSNTQFEPHVADSILKSMAAAESNLTVLYGYALASVTMKNGVVAGASFKNIKTGKLIKIDAAQTIDATELGDVMKMAGVPYSLGMEAGSVTGETVGVDQTNDIVQDLTYVAILKDYGRDRDCTIAKPRGYDPNEFDGSNTDYYKDQTRKKPNVDAQKMLDYGKLPNQKYMLNWPIYGNDSYLNIVELDPAQRSKELEKAKQQTLRFVYFIQKDLGFKHLGLTNDEFPTADRLALIPYHREGRRLKGIVRYTMTQIAHPFDQELYRTGISVGDYPIDHHHKKNLNAPQQLEFYPVPSYNIPLACLIPENTDGLIVAEKGISVSNVANGTTRLQPVVMLTGQAAGVLAALSAKENVAARKIEVRAVQSELLAHKAYLMPYNDVKPDHPDFKAIQRVGATGILRGRPTPHAWANQTWFYPDSLVNAQEFLKDVKTVLPVNGGIISQHLSLGEAIILLQTVNINIPVEESVRLKYKSWGWKDANPSHLLTRGELARMIDELFDPFRLPIDHKGELVK